MTKPSKPTPDFPLFPHASGQWAKKIGGRMRYFGPWSDPDAALVRYQGTTEQRIASTSPSGKPPKPTPDFPLYAHNARQWAKRIRGRVRYFGPWSDPEAALAKYLKQKDDLYAGRKPSNGKGLTVGKLVDQFLAVKKSQTEEGRVEERISPRTLNDYDRICGKIKEVLGQSQLASIVPDDFARLRAAFAKTHGLVTLGKDIAVTRMLFKYALGKRLIDRPIDFGVSEFKRPERRALRKLRRENGMRMFQADEIRRIIDKAGVPLRAMIYLGINCGLGNNDCAMLPMSALDDGWLEYPRPKTAVDRRCPLWPETVEALREALAARPTPKDPASKDRFFITRHRTTWEPKSISDNPVSKEMRKVLGNLKIHRLGLGFYALRHTFQTIGEKTRDYEAVRYIMGHAEAANDMSAVYSEEAPEDSRLLDVTNYVRAWLFPTGGEQ